VKIVYEDKEVLVVDKPASWPVHPCGNYRLNSLLYILARELGYRNLRPVHRLDKVSILYPCGNCRLNSLLYILAREQGYRNLRPVHRLDKVSILCIPVVTTGSTPSYTSWPGSWVTGTCAQYIGWIR
jgi:23S rRNA-/tRNA-specific pseudouridylate synthase